MAGVGYDIGASLANAAGSGANPYENASTVIIFGNGNNPSQTNDDTPTQENSATATTALPGGSAVSTSTQATAPTPLQATAPTPLQAAVQTVASSVTVGKVLVFAGIALIAYYFIQRK